MDPTEFRQRFANWKAGKKVYDAGRPIPKYDDGTDGKTYLPEYEYEATVTPQGTSLEKHKRITNEEDWQKYWGNVGAGYVNRAQEAAAPVVGGTLLAAAALPAAALGTGALGGVGISRILPVARTIIGEAAAAELAGQTWNGIYKDLSGKDWSTGLADNIENTTGWRPSEQVTGFFNPGYFMGGAVKKGVELMANGVRKLFPARTSLVNQVQTQSIDEDIARLNIGRALKPVTNWFAAKALSNSIDDAVATPTFSKVLPATEQIWQDLNLPHRSYKSGSISGPFTEEVFRRNGIFDAFDAFNNPARKQLIDRLSEEAGFPLQISTGHGKLPGTIKILTDLDADKILGKNVLGRRDGYTLYARESADPTTVFHEALHLQGFGNVDWDWPKLQSLVDDYQKKGLNLAQLESSGAPFMQIRDAKRDYYAAKQAYKQLFEQKTATEQFLEQKVESVLRDDAEEYIRQPHEFVVHGLQAGRKVGLKPYQPEPMYDPYNTGVPIVDFGKIMETVHSAIKKHNWMADLKLDTPQDYHNAWKVLTGNFLPAAVITGGTFGALQEHDKGKSIHINPANKGKFNATKKRTGKTTEQLAHSKNPLTRKRAIFALNSRKFKH